MNKGKEEKNAEISARISKVIDYLRETPNSFAVKLGYKRAQTIYDIRDMKSAPSFDFFYRFCVAGYSVIINIEWLLTGEEPMLKKDIVFQEPPPTNQNEKADLYYSMYKEQLGENKYLIEEIGALKERLRQYTSDITSFQDLPSIRSDVAKRPKQLSEKDIVQMSAKKGFMLKNTNKGNKDNSVADSANAGYTPLVHGNKKKV